jgi:hypothetical protein
MTENEQTHEMAKVLEFACENMDCTNPINCSLCQAKQLYSKGYRKVERGEWIDVKERIPDWSDGKVLVFTKYGFSVCERTTSNRWQGQYANWITHWMPLPEPPSEADMRKEAEGNERCMYEM